MQFVRIGIPFVHELLFLIQSVVYIEKQKKIKEGQVYAISIAE